MFAAILILLILPVVDQSNIRGLTFKPVSKLLFLIFIANFLTLRVLGAKHVEAPYIVIGQICTFIYFAYFLFLVAGSSLLSNFIARLESSPSPWPEALFFIAPKYLQY